MPIVDIKGANQSVRFPDDMSEDEILSILRQSDLTASINQRLQPIQGQAMADNASLRDTASGKIAEYLKRSGLIKNNYQAQRVGENLTAFLEFAPGLGDASAGDDFGRSLAQGDKLGMGISALSMLPVVGKAAGKGLKAGLKELDNLPMDEASRMARAKEMGFNPERTYYHGTSGDIASFDPAKKGDVTESRSAKKAFWFTDDPEVTARSYAEYSSRDMPVKRKLRDADLAEKRGDWDEYDRALAEAEKLEQDIIDDPLRGQTIMPITLPDTEEMIVRDMKGRSFDDFGVSDEIDEILDDAKSMGMKGVVFDNLNDAVGFANKPARHVAIFSPENIRSKFAKFDPSKRESAKITAGVAGGSFAGLLGYKATSNDDEFEQDKEDKKDL